MNRDVIKTEQLQDAYTTSYEANTIGEKNIIKKCSSVHLRLKAKYSLRFHRNNLIIVVMNETNTT